MGIGARWRVAAHRIAAPPRAARRLSIAALAGLLAACGTTTIDPRSGEKLIRSDVNKLGTTSVRSVSCPSGVKPVVRTTFECEVVLVQKGSGVQRSGTITVHVVTANRIEVFGSQDVHLR
ncbi:MAG: DUF4333 domain-containing protein [Solirubrobacteraceae bacterium]